MYENNELVDISKYANTPDEKRHKYLTNRSLRTIPSNTREYLVEGLYIRREINFIYSAPGIGKSYITQDVVNRMAEGLPVFGLNTNKPLRSMYIDCEYGDTIYRKKERQQKLENGYVNQGVYLVNNSDYIANYFPAEDDDIDRCLDVTNPVHEERIIEMVRAHQSDIIIFDALYNIFKGKMTEPEDVSPFINAVNRIAYKTNTCIIIIHHSRKSGNNKGYDDPLASLFGSFVFGAAMGSGIYLQKCAKGIKCVESKSRDSQVIRPWYMSIDDTDNGGVIINMVSGKEEKVQPVKEETVSKQEQAEPAILQAIKDGYVRNKDISSYLAGQGIASKRIINGVIPQLIDSGKVMRIKGKLCVAGSMN
ncbi:MAG: AAA family ATPase [Armatimonadota bacterium]